ncbi:MAG TPA: AP2 domain-containing protein [Blastocatellia bacterium]|nr:AP2 domain-containing protein [Blastocatellia bacterium]
MTKSGHKGISRIDQPSRNTFGWYVRVMFNGKQVSKFFSDKVHGSKRQALDAAVTYRDEAEKKLGRPRTDRQVIARQTRNTSGIVGVQRRTKVVRTKDGERIVSKYYVVTWNPEPGRVETIFVPVEKYGERGALLKACSIRREKEKQIYGTVLRTNWEASLAKLVS